MQNIDPGVHEAREIDEVLRRLQARFPDAAVDIVRAAVADAHRVFDGRPIRDFVPVFVERAARAALTSQPLTRAPVVGGSGTWSIACVENRNGAAGDVHRPFAGPTQAGVDRRQLDQLTPNRRWPGGFVG